MKILKFCFFISVLVLVLPSCSKSPQAIDYGNDACHYCQMTIVDKIHGAELITDKGKVYKFDAVECLIRYKSELETLEGYQFLSNYFEQPGEFVRLKDAYFLISKNLPSPMGAYLTVFKTDASANKMKNEKGGNLHNLKEVAEHLK